MKLSGILFGLFAALSFSFAEITPLHCGNCGPEKKECEKECEKKKDCDKECDSEKKDCDKECDKAEKEDKKA